MTRFWAAALGFMFVSTVQAAQPQPSCQGLLSDPEVYAKVEGAVLYTVVVNNGSGSTSDKIFSDVAHWLEAESIWLEGESQLYTRLQKIRSEIDSAQMREQIRACYPNLDNLLDPEAAKQAVAAKRAEAAKQAEAAEQAEAAKRAEALKQREEAARQALEAGAPARAQAEEAARQAWEAGAPARAKEAAKQAEAARQAWEAGAPARAEEAAKQAEARRQAEEAARQAETEYKLKVAYSDYIVVKRCHDDIEGYLPGYISEPQLAKAQAAVSAIEQKIKSPNIDLDALRKQAETVADYKATGLGRMPQAWPGHPSNPVEILCNGALGELIQNYVLLFPEEAGAKNDF
jgi:hypothetical protein